MSPDRTLPHKKVVASIYETEAFTSLLKEVLHPGGIDLTRRMAEIARPEPGSAVLDIGCGIGAGCELFSHTYGCHVIGVDLSEKRIALARGRTRDETPAGKTAFTVCDAECLPFRNGCFDLVLSECVFSILPDKTRAAEEFSRVLRSKGKMLISDVVLKEGAPSQAGRDFPAEDRMPLIPCLSGAAALEDYTGLFERAGLHPALVEDHTVSFRKVAYQMALSFGDWSGFLGKLCAQLSARIPCSEGVEGNACSLDRYRTLLSRAKLGYALIGMTKP